MTRPPNPEVEGLQSCSLTCVVALELLNSKCRNRDRLWLRVLSGLVSSGQVCASSECTSSVKQTFHQNRRERPNRLERPEHFLRSGLSMSSKISSALLALPIASSRSPICMYMRALLVSAAPSYLRDLWRLLHRAVSHRGTSSQRRLSVEPHLQLLRVPPKLIVLLSASARQSGWF